MHATQQALCRQQQRQEAALLSIQIIQQHPTLEVHCVNNGHATLCIPDSCGVHPGSCPFMEPVATLCFWGPS